MGRGSTRQKFLHHFAPEVTAIHAQHRRGFAAADNAAFAFRHLGLDAQRGIIRAKTFVRRFDTSRAGCIRFS